MCAACGMVPEWGSLCGLVLVLQRVSRGVASDDALAGYSSKEDLFGVDPVAARSPSEVIEVRLKHPAMTQA